MRSFCEFVWASFVFVAFTFLVGCANSGVKQTINLDQNSGKGVIIVSALQTFAESEAPGLINASVDSAHLIIKSKDGVHTDTINIFDQVQQLWMTSSRLPIPDTANGDLRVLELPAGEYAIVGWRMAQATYGSIMPTKELSIPFKVVSGEPTYLGEVTLEVHRSSSLGVGTNSAVHVVIADKRERDLAHLRKVHPELPTEKIDIQILQAQ